MAKLIGGYALGHFLLIAFMASMAAVGLTLMTRPLVFYAATNRVLNNSVYAQKTVRSAVICGRECGMDKRCRSVNYYRCGNTCHLNNDTRLGSVDSFVEDQGSVYFDNDEDTPLSSLADSAPIFENCQDLYDAGYSTSGVFTIYPAGFDGDCLRVYCDLETEGVGWLVFQRRQDGSVDFYRNWTEFQAGFGDLSGEFWLGNDNLLKLTSQGTWELRVDLGDWEGNTAWAKYSSFSITGQEYTLLLGQYDTSSTAGDSFSGSSSEDFSTKERDNDDYSIVDCAESYRGAWWYYSCSRSQLNGFYYNSSQAGSDKGITWYEWRSAYSLKSCSMNIRRTDI